ncbi:MAG: Ig-like domain-containing protein [Clostridia bacterium]|nr:Ig-like domain-containing protein [Clostridia bacterium]MBQ8658967.1 Ig-like domain-containing protein [Clostridia bacterium]
MGKMKKFGVWLLSALACTSFALFSACAQQSEKPSDVEPPQKTLTLDKTETSLLIGEEMSLKATYDGIEGEKPSFDSSQKNVASVTDDGKVTAISRGETTITVSYGDLTQTCIVSVGLGNEVPVLSFTQMPSDEATVSRGDTLNLENYVSFNGKTFTDASITYEFSNDALAEMNGNVLTPVKTGETTLTVSANWRGETGATLEKTLRITIIDEVNLYVNDGERDTFTLYTAENFAGNTFQKSIPFETHAIANGKAVDCNVALLDNATEYVSLENGVLSAKAEGVVKVKLSCAVGTGDEAKEYSREITVNVVLPVAEYSTPIPFSAYDGNVDFKSVFGEEVSVVKAESEGNAITVEDNLLKGIEADNGQVLEKKVSVYTATCGYHLTLKVYTRILDEADDLAIFDLATATTVIEGQYLLGKDIDATSATPNSHLGYGVKNSYTTSATAGFAGTLDGNGKTLKFNFDTCGLLGRLLDGATVKNIALDGAQTVNTQNKLTPSLLAHTMENDPAGNGVKIENVYAKMKQSVNVPTYSVSVLGTRDLMLLMTNVVVECLNMDLTKRTGVLFYADNTRNYQNAGTNTALDKAQAKLSNVYVVSNSSYMAQWGNATTADGITSVKAIVANNVDTTNYSLLDNSTYAYTGVNVYESYTALAEVSFDGMLWSVDVANSTLIWKS